MELEGPGQSDRPRIDVVEVVTHGDREASPFARGLGVAALAVIAVMLAVAVGAVVDRHDGRRHAAVSGVRQAGDAGVAAADGYPLRCLIVTSPVTDRSYARADFNHSTCPGYTRDPTAIFRRVAGIWRPVLNADRYDCPVGSLPVAVQKQLGVCPRVDRNRSVT